MPKGQFQGKDKTEETKIEKKMQMHFFLWADDDDDDSDYEQSTWLVSDRFIIDAFVCNA